MNEKIRIRLSEGNRRYMESADEALRVDLAEHGQHPFAIVIACSDSRVIPEQIFDAVPGELFVIRVAGNVLDKHQLGSVEYAAGHLHCDTVIVLGHTGCGAVGAALSDGGEGYIKYITDEIQSAIGGERDPDRASPPASTWCMRYPYWRKHFRITLKSEISISPARYTISGRERWSGFTEIGSGIGLEFYGCPAQPIA